MGFYAPAQLVRNAREHGVEVRPVDVNASRWDCTLERAGESSEEQAELAIRLGLRLINGLSEAQARAIEAARASGGPFTGWDDFARRTRLSRAVMTRLAEADAFASLELDRRGALWQALAEEKKPRTMPLFDVLAAERRARCAASASCGLKRKWWPTIARRGLSLKAHPMQFLRERAECAGRFCRPSDWPRIRRTGMSAWRASCWCGSGPARPRASRSSRWKTRPGQANLIIRQDVWQKFYRVARTATALHRPRPAAASRSDDPRAGD